jgi:hypothetical protein
VTFHRSVRLVAAFIALGLTAALLATATPSPSAARGHGHGHHGHGHHGHGHHGHGHKGKVVWDSTTYYAGGGAVAAHGRVPGGKTKVKLQVKLPGGWEAFAKTKSSRKGKFAISGVLNWYGAHKVRVSTSGRHHFNRSTTATVLTSYTPRGNPADSVLLNYQGVRYAFDPCKTVRYAVNVDDVGPGALQLIQIAMDQVSMATGIKVKYVGPSHQIPFQGETTKLPAGQDMLLAFADQAEIPEFVTVPAVGLGGSVQQHAARDGHNRPVWETTQAAAVFDTTRYFAGNYEWSFQGTRPLWSEIILHEIGHAFGLDHAPAADEIMYWQAGNGVYPDGYFRGLYDAGDLTGLATNGLGQGCFRKVRHFKEGVPARIPAPQPLP